MNVKTLLACGELLLAIGDDPGRTVRHYVTVRKEGRASVNSTLLAKIGILREEGLLDSSPGEYRGRPTVLLTLSPAGQGAYGLLRALRELVS